MDLLSQKAHVIQIVKTVASLSSLGLKVKLIVKKVGRNPEYVLEDIGIHRGTENLEIVEYKRDKLPLLLAERAILGDSACYFKFNDLDSMREAITQVVADSAFYLSLRRKSARLRAKYMWLHKGMELLKFIEGIV